MDFEGVASKLAKLKVKSKNDRKAFARDDRAHGADKAAGIVTQLEGWRHEALSKVPQDMWAVAECDKLLAQARPLVVCR